MGKGTFKAYEKGEWGGDVVGAWGALMYFFFLPMGNRLGEGVMQEAIILKHPLHPLF
ncbi:hypothetical protein D3C81_986470 [compost metagenome]